MKKLEDGAIAIDARVAGLLCSEVLGKLSAFLDGELPDAEVRQIQAHVAGCHTCERFGGRFQRAVNALRSWSPEPLDAGVEDRLGRALGLGAK